MYFDCPAPQTNTGGHQIFCPEKKVPGRSQSEKISQSDEKDFLQENCVISAGLYNFFALMYKNQKL